MPKSFVASRLGNLAMALLWKRLPSVLSTEFPLTAKLKKKIQRGRHAR
jgi:hypothetical protein